MEEDFFTRLFDLPKTLNEAAEKIDKAAEYLASSTATVSHSFNNLYFKSEHKNNPLHGKSVRIQISNSSFNDKD